MTSHHDDLPPLPITERVPLGRLDREAGRAFDMAPDEAGLAALARHLSVEGLEGLRFAGRIEPFQKDGWRVEGRITGTVRQSCVVTLDPVVGALDLAVARIFLPGAAAVGPVDVAPEDIEDGGEEPPEPLGDAIDLAQILVEELALAIDPYPRVAGVELGELRHAAPGVAPIEPDALRPFASLSELRNKLAKGRG